MSIPGKIIQTGKSRNLSPAAKASATNLRLLHPEWEYLFFDDADVQRFINTEFPQYRAVFDSFQYHIQRFDFFRYLAVLRFGGFYFDLDVFLSENLSGLLKHKSIFPFEELTLNRHLREHHAMDWEIGNYAFGATPGNPFLELVIENCVKAQRDSRWVNPMMTGIPGIFRADFNVLNSTGPGLLTRTYVENPATSADVTVLFPEDVCDEKSWHNFGSYGVHLMEGSWRSKGSFVRRRLAGWWESRVRKKYLPQSRQLGPKRSPLSRPSN